MTLQDEPKKQKESKNKAGSEVRESSPDRQQMTMAGSGRGKF